LRTLVILTVAKRSNCCKELLSFKAPAVIMLAILLIPTLLIAFALAVAIIWMSMPLLQRYALARPNARSSHRIPTPQGGGIAVVTGTLLTTYGSAVVAGVMPGTAAAISMAGGTLVLALIGAWDDIRPMAALPRLALQAACVALLLGFAPVESGLLPENWPAGLGLAIALLAGLWFVNLVNFMDGLDWITVAEMVPVTAALAIFGGLGFLDPFAALLAASLCGALCGFALFNKPVARLFLGDVGSLPIGLMVAWLLYLLATNGYVAAAILLPLYFCADATITLIRRAVRRERLFEAHRSHIYQRATDHGFSAIEVAGNVLAVNLILILLASATLFLPHPAIQIVALAIGLAIVLLLLKRFSNSKI
jgi:UDP-N-acetylmuramyl pentapeptide phosphotransferase/UDP-N-acetylglucosamine-1-phosphate transferase